MDEIWKGIWLIVAGTVESKGRKLSLSLFKIEEKPGVVPNSCARRKSGLNV
jgi:hypothetical protein